MKPQSWAIVVTAVLSMLAALVSQVPSLGASGLLHPSRRQMTAAPPAGCGPLTVTNDGHTLRGWRCPTVMSRRGTLVYLHGIADNRMSSVGIISRFTARGFDVVAYDSRAHGQSDGDACTYGYFEKRDLARVLDHVNGSPIVLLGTSLGAAVALQAAADDRRISAIVAAEVFSDLRSVVRDRVPRFVPSSVIDRAIRTAEAQGHFSADAVSPLLAAHRISAPVLLVHGEADVLTPPDHSRRVFSALKGPKRLLIVPEARHNESLRREVWPEIDGWIDRIIALR